jgi:hypothetical protein
MVTSSYPRPVRQYRAKWTAINTWSIRVGLIAGANSLSLVGYDKWGEPVSGTSKSIVVTFTGTNPNPVGSLVINELMISPKKPGAEFIEIYNRSGTATFDMSGMVLSGLGLTVKDGTVIGPGDYVVFGQNEIVFTETYGSVPLRKYGGDYPGSLDNAGETIILMAADGATEIDRVTYGNTAPWPPAAFDGTGASLQCIDNSKDNNVHYNWGVDTNTNLLSTPGSVNSVSGTVPTPGGTVTVRLFWPAFRE